VDILTLLVIATAVNGLLAGGSIFQSVVEVPEWRTKSKRSAVAFGRTTDLRIGSVLYRLMEFGASLFSVTAAVSFFSLLRGQPPSMSAIATYLAAALSTGSIIVSTQAALTERSRDRIGDDEEALTKSSARPVRWQAQRSILQGSAFVTILLALVART
jgi:hypothetical protein